jgi:hypothetical protein
MAALLGSGATFARGEGNFSIVLDAGPTLAANPQAVAAFDRAADEWSSHITSAFPVTIYIAADFSNTLDGQTIAQTTLNATDLSFDRVRSAITAQAKPDAPAMGLLPTSSTIQVHTAVANTFDRDQIFIQSANQKVLGLMPGTSTGPDGTVQFNGNFAFDYNGTTIQKGETDFQSAAAHEIGHVLGFDSSVDDFDGNLNGYFDLMPLDLYRFSASSAPTTLAGFTTAVRDLDPRDPAVTTDTQYTYAMSSGTIHGDGNGASHWKADELNNNYYIGVMDPTLGTSQIDPVTSADLRALELIGYDATPEPAGSLVLCGIVVMGLLARRREGRSQPTSVRKLLREHSGR